MERTEGEHHTPDMGSEQVNLLISLLIRFPQVSAVHYDPADRSLRFVYLLRDVHREQLHSFVEKAKHIADVSQYRQFRSGTKVAAIQHEQAEDLWVLQDRRDVAV